MRTIYLSLFISLILPVLSVCAVLNVPSEYPTVAEALEWVQEYDTVLLDSGTYYGPGFQSIEYCGSAFFLMGTYGAEKTIIDLLGSYFIRVYYEFECAHELASRVVTIEGITFTHGNPAVDYGPYSQINLGECVFDDNDVAICDSVFYGGGYIDSCVFVDNVSAFYFEDESYEWFSNCVFKSNEWAVFPYQGMNASFDRCIFVENFFAIYCLEGGIVDLSQCCLYRNVHGIYGYLSSLALTCNDIYGNDADFVYCPSPIGTNGNISEEPYFCDTIFATLDVASISPLLPEHNDCGVNIGNVSIGCYCGDINASGQRDISDLTFLVSYMFDGGPAPDPLWAGDVDGSGGTDISDITYYVDYLFSSGPDPEC